MAFNGSGVFLRLYSWVTDRNNGINILASRMDNEMNGMATGLTTCITKDGQSTPTADIPLGGFKLKNVGDATLAADAVNAAQIQGGLLTYYADTGAADAYVITTTPTIAAYAAGQAWSVKITNANLTTTPTLNVNAVGAKTIKLSDGSAPAIGLLAVGAIIDFIYDGTYMQVSNSSSVTAASFTTLAVSGLATFNGDIKVINSINDTNNNEVINIASAASAVNEVTVGNAATGNFPYISASGGDSNIGIALQAKGTGTYNLLGTADASAEVRLSEDTDNGANYIGLKSPASVSANCTFILPGADGSADQYLKTDGSKNLGFATLPTNSVKAWVNFTGATGAVNASVGVTSVTRNSAGDYTIVLSTTQPDANYAILGNCIGQATRPQTANVKNGTTPTTTTFVILVRDTANAAVDPTTVYVAIIGN